MLPPPAGSPAAAAAAAPRFKELRAMKPLRLEGVGPHQGWRVEGEAIEVAVDGEGVLRGLRIHGDEVAFPTPYPYPYPYP